MKACIFLLNKYDDILWLNACYVLNVSWNMKNNYFRKVYFKWHMIWMVSRPLGEKNIARGDVIRVGS